MDDPEEWGLTKKTGEEETGKIANCSPEKPGCFWLFEDIYRERVKN